jgi:hypothetical protein
VRPHFDVPVAEIIRRARRITLVGGSLAIPDPADQLLHLCLHAAVSNGRKLVWLLDIDQAVRRDTPDHDVLVRRAHRWKVGLPAAIMLERSRRVLHTPVSDQLLDDLAPNGLWRRWCHVVLSARPPETAADAVLSGGVVVASTRESTVPSVAALVRAVWRDGVREPLRNENHPWRRLFAGGRRG